MSVFFFCPRVDDEQRQKEVMGRRDRIIERTAHRRKRNRHSNDQITSLCVSVRLYQQIIYCCCCGGCVLVCVCIGLFVCTKHSQPGVHVCGVVIPVPGTHWGHNMMWCLVSRLSKYVHNHRATSDISYSSRAYLYCACWWYLCLLVVSN